MKSEYDTKTLPLARVGGKRAGSGRKAIDPQGTIVTTVRLTAEQRATFDLLGGPAWLRETLQAFIEKRIQ